MKTTLTALALLAATLLLPALPAQAAGNISATDRYAWSGAAGWTNFRPDNGGVTVRDTWLAGTAWNESVGWIKLGASTGGPYANDSASNWGVNRLGSTLSGYAWSTVAGWINFAPEQGGVTIAADGSFDGWAWSESLGWIHFQSPPGTPLEGAYKVAYVDEAPNPETYTVTPSTGAGGSLFPGTAQSVTEGQTTSFAAVADTGFHIESVTGCGGSLVGVTYTTGATTADCTVNALFDESSNAVNSGGHETYGDGGVNVTFEQVTGGGQLTATPTANPAPPSNFRVVTGAAYEITTTASFNGTVEVCLPYDEAALADAGNEVNLKLFHRTAGGWQDITTYVDTVGNRICGETTSLSPFIIAEPVPDPSAGPTPVPVASGWWLLAAFGAGLGMLGRRRRG